MRKVAMALLLVAVIVFTFTTAQALERCKQYTSEVKRATAAYWGVDFPWWYALGQAQTESNCRPDAFAFDGGQGMFQFMPATAREIKKQMREDVSPLNSQQAARMSAFFMFKLHKQNPSGYLWVTYQAYNGGYGPLLSEHRRAGVWDHKLMRTVCQRKIIKLKNGSLLSFCDVNYEYSERVYKYGNLYRAFPVDSVSFWAISE